MIVRAVSLFLAASVSAGLLVLPAVRGGELSQAEHGLLALALLAICGLFAGGLGYVPANRWLRAAVSPLLLWPMLLGLGVAWMRLA
jgi:predicted membrane protein